MRLQPKRPPGRADRKAAAFASEIVQLRAEGYTYEAIREALAEFGIEVTEGTLRREIRRQQRSLHTIPGARPLSQIPDDLPRPVQRALPAGASSSMLATGREIAEAFFDAHPSNPLFLAKETS